VLAIICSVAAASPLSLRISMTPLVQKLSRLRILERLVALLFPGRGLDGEGRVLDLEV
jgi:hypothetical protein